VGRGGGQTTKGGGWVNCGHFLKPHIAPSSNAKTSSKCKDENLHTVFAITELCLINYSHQNYLKLPHVVDLPILFVLDT